MGIGDTWRAWDCSQRFYVYVRDIWGYNTYLHGKIRDSGAVGNY